MTKRRSKRVIAMAAAVVLLATSGCGGINRRFVIESNVPNAQVYINNRPVGAAPAHAAFEYYGYYNIELVHPDCKREVRRIHVVAPWYAYPPIDFFAEFWPFRVDDVHRYYIELQPARRTDTGELIMNAENLRQQGWNLPAPAVDPRAVPGSGALPGPAPTLPPPTPLPAAPSGSGPAPVIPSVTPPIGP